MRHKFKTNRIASSDNYELAKTLHRNYIYEEHKRNKKIIVEIESSIVIKKKAYVSIFGDLIQITEEEASRIENNINIIWK